MKCIEKFLLYKINARMLSLNFTRNGTRLDNTSPSADVFKYLAYEFV